MVLRRCIFGIRHYTAYRGTPLSIAIQYATVIGRVICVALLSSGIACSKHLTLGWQDTKQESDCWPFTTPAGGSASLPGTSKDFCQVYSTIKQMMAFMGGLVPLLMEFS
jgi:hypothetical protein